jgi:hypothetical protein
MHADRSDEYEKNDRTLKNSHPRKARSAEVVRRSSAPAHRGVFVVSGRKYRRRHATSTLETMSNALDDPRRYQSHLSQRSSCSMYRDHFKRSTMPLSAMAILPIRTKVKSSKFRHRPAHSISSAKGRTYQIVGRRCLKVFTRTCTQGAYEWSFSGHNLASSRGGIMDRLSDAYLRAQVSCTSRSVSTMRASMSAIDSSCEITSR